MLLVETVRKAGLDAAISAALTPWRKARAVRHPGKILLDVALAVALGGDCLADVAMLRAESAVFAPVGHVHTAPAWFNRNTRTRATEKRNDSPSECHAEYCEAHRK